MNLHFVPLNKYDCVIEHFDGTITIPPHEKKRYLFTCEKNNKIFILNNIDGCVYQYDIEKDTALQISSYNSDFLKDKIGFSIYKNLFVTFDNEKRELIFFNQNKSISTKKLDIPINNFTIFDNSLWGINREEALILQIDIELNNVIKKIPYHGIGNASIVIKDNFIYLTDSDENTLKVIDIENHKLKFEAITPFIDPIGQIFYNNKHYILYSGLVNEVGYDNHCWQEQKPFFHELKLHLEKKDNYLLAYTNSFEVDFFYEENLYEGVINEKLPLTIDLAIPPETIHQSVIDIHPLGHDFELIEINKVKYARFTIEHPNVKAIGYKAKLKLQSVKYNFINEDDLILSNEDLLSEKDKIDLGVNSKYFDQFVIKEKQSDIETVRYLRNLIYSKLYYKKNIKATSFEEVLKDGYGTCGDYTSLIMILLHKNSISCQSAGGYKIPRFYNATSGIISVYYNHAWLEIFNHKQDPIPFESSSDDKEFGGRYSEGQFLGIDWTHIKLYNGKAYPNLMNISSHPEIHPFDILKKAGVFVIVKGEL